MSQLGRFVSHRGDRRLLLPVGRKEREKAKARERHLQERVQRYSITGGYCIRRCPRATGRCHRSPLATGDSPGQVGTCCGGVAAKHTRMKVVACPSTTAKVATILDRRSLRWRLKSMNTALGLISERTMANASAGPFCKFPFRSLTENPPPGALRCLGGKFIDKQQVRGEETIGRK